jgi:serine/threonine-protein kinase SRPK3
VLFQVSETVRSWSDDKINKMLGKLWTEDVRTYDGTSPQPAAPPLVVEAAELSRIASFNLLLKDITLIDFGQAFAIPEKPAGYVPATVVHYCPPEMRFELCVCPASDVWMLACLLFELRAGYPLFEPNGGPAYVLRDMVRLLGRLPDPWWGEFRERGRWFDETGAPHPHARGAQALTLREELRGIGRKENPKRSQKTPLQERPGACLDEAEVKALGDLLEKMLRYRPEHRLTISHVVRHPWFCTYGN